MQVIPGEAVEAAARKLYATLTPYSWDGLLPSRQDSWRTHARAALEAAAPHLMAGLRSELVKLAQEFDAAEGGTLAYTAILDGGHSMRKNAHDQLMYIIDNHLVAPNV